MTSAANESYTPTGAWIASGLTLATLPILLYPLARSSRQAPWREREWVWIAMGLSHCCLTAFAILCATETACEDNQVFQDFDYGWETLRSNCARNTLILAVDLTECLVAPLYPTSMLLLYLNLLSRGKKRRLRPVITSAVVLQGLLSVALFAITLLARALVWSSDAVLLDISYETGNIHFAIFNAWFTVMLAYGFMSLILCTRLLPHIKVKASTAASSPCTTESALQARNLATAEVPLGKRTEVIFDFPHGKHRIIAPHSVGPAEKEVRLCVRWLWVCICAIFVILVANIIAVSVQLDPPVLRTSLGWVSCHCISFALYMATSLVKRAVIARRMVPQSMAGTLGESGWSADADE